MRTYYILALGFVFVSCFDSTEKQILGKWTCYEETFYSPNEVRVDTLLNRQMFEFKADYTYEQHRWNLNGTGTWVLTKYKSADQNILSMTSDKGANIEYLIEELNRNELVLVVVDTTGGETLTTKFRYRRLNNGQPIH